MISYPNKTRWLNQSGISLINTLLVVQTSGTTSDIVERDNFVEVQNGRSIKLPNLWLVGYGDWTGMASATLIGVSRTARATVDEIFTYLQEINTKKFSE